MFPQLHEAAKRRDAVARGEAVEEAVEGGDGTAGEAPAEAAPAEAAQPEAAPPTDAAADAPTDATVPPEPDSTSLDHSGFPSTRKPSAARGWITGTAAM